MVNLPLFNLILIFSIDKITKMVLVAFHFMWLRSKPLKSYGFGSCWEVLLWNKSLELTIVTLWFLHPSCSSHMRAKMSFYMSNNCNRISTIITSKSHSLLTLLSFSSLIHSVKTVIEEIWSNMVYCFSILVENGIRNMGNKAKKQTCYTSWNHG